MSRCAPINCQVAEDFKPVKKIIVITVVSTLLAGWYKYLYNIDSVFDCIYYFTPKLCSQYKWRMSKKDLFTITLSKELNRQ